MEPIFSVSSIRDAESQVLAQTAGDELMILAATQLANVVASRLRALRGGCYGARILLLVGAGNNGGDALYAGARLASYGAKVEYLLVAGMGHEGGLAALHRAGGIEIVLSEVRHRLWLTECDCNRVIPDFDVVIDGIYGIGGRGGLPPEIRELVPGLLASSALLVAVDVPSGLVADSCVLPEVVSDSTVSDSMCLGRAVNPIGDAGFNYIPAQLTVTFGGKKLCQVAEPAKSACGEVEVIDIGISPKPDSWQLGAEDISALWPAPDVLDHKYTRGVVGLAVGSTQYPGAAVMATAGAVAAGPGMVRLIDVAADIATDVIRQFPNVVPGDGKVTAILAGCGWGRSISDSGAGGEQRLRLLVARKLPMVIDADALGVLADISTAGRILVLPEDSLLTPHAGELARLLGVTVAEITADPIKYCRAAATHYQATVLLKGATQYCVSPSGDVMLAVPGPAWTAQAGSGDVLAGVAATLLAAGVTPWFAGVLAASVQAVAAASLPGPITPSHLAQTFRQVIAGN